MICKACGYVVENSEICPNCGTTISENFFTNYSSPINEPIKKQKSAVFNGVVIFVVMALIGVFLMSIKIDFWGNKKDKAIFIDNLGIYKNMDIDGVEIILTTGSNSVTDDEIYKIRDILQEKIGVFISSTYELKVEMINGGAKFIIKIPQLDRPERIANILKGKSELKFIEGIIDENDISTPIPSGNIILNSEDIVSAKVMEITNMLDDKEYYIELTILDEAVDKFANATEKMIGSPMMVYLDNEVLMAPYVNERLETNHPVITGGYFEEEAAKLARLISLGPLSFELIVESAEVVDNINE